MLNTININLKTDIKTDRPTTLPIKLMSQDKNNNQFILRFTNGGESVTLDDTYTVEVLTKFTKSGTSRLTTAKVRQDYATWEFDAAYITQDETVYNYVYVRKSGNLVVSADANFFVFSVDLSEIDKGAGKVAETYDENYEKYLDEFKENVDFEEIAQAEQARKEAEILREESYEQKVDTAIVEADVEEKVDNKVSELAPQINSLTAQLAQNAGLDLKRNIIDSSVLNIGPKKDKQPLITFVDDDGSLEVYKRLKPIFEQRGVPCTVAIVSDWVGGNEGSIGDMMSKAQLLELQSIGWEVSSHEKTHTGMADITDEQTIKNELITSKTKLLEMGFDVKNLVYPFGQKNDTLVKKAKQVYKIGVATGDGTNAEVNNFPLNNFNVRRVALGSYAPDGKDTLEHHKSVIDKAISENGWLIFMTHVWAQSAEKDQLIADVIDYALLKNVEITTLEGALNVFGDKLNIDDMLRVLPDNSIVTDRLVVNVSDTLIGDSTKANDVGFIKGNYKKNHIVHTKILSNVAGGFPENRAGILITDLTSDELGYIKQIYKIYGNDNEYRRTTNASGVFSDWKLVTLRVKNTIITDYEIGLIPAHSTKEVVFDVSGVTTQDNIVVSPMSSTQPGYVWSGRTVAGKVVLRVANVTPSPITVTGNNWKFVIIKG